MKFEAKLKEVQASLVQEGMTGWLLFDFRRSNPLACNFLEIPPEKMLTRRFFYWIPQRGDPIKIVSLIEPFSLNHLPGVTYFYREWQEMERLLLPLALENTKIAMEYSPYNALPTISKIDAGTVELIRRMGVEVVSSANILQRYTSIWTSEQLKSHLAAAKVLESIVDRAWAFIERSLFLHHPVDEYQVQQFMLQAMHEEGCQTADWPTCAVNAHSADPHYHPEARESYPIRKGDFILLDLWCKQQQTPQAVYADITRVGVAALKPTEKQQEIFNIVKHARDQATLLIKDSYENHRPLQGWQVDQACRDVIKEAGYGDYFIHRTGHNIGEDVHGPGANLDNFETHDDRQLLPGTAFSVEPGIYLPQQFGVRLEYDIYLDLAGKVCITGGIQKELVCLQV
jgi:Xaa-Pro aminopeptidase